MNKKSKTIILVISTLVFITACIFAGVKISSKNNSEKERVTADTNHCVQTAAKEPTEITDEQTTESTKESEVTTKAERPDDGSLIKASDSDFELLGTDITSYDSFMIMMCNTLYDGYDYSKYSAKDVVQKIIDWGGLSWVYTYYFGEIKAIDYNTTPDPLKKFNTKGDGNYYTGKYYKYSVENVNWILKHIFNKNPEIIKDFDESVYDEAVPYCYDGYYYFNAPIAGGGGVNVRYKDGSAKELKDGTYSIEIECQYGDAPICDYGNAIVGLKEVNGKKYWSVYKIEVTRDEG